jgi:hypothetical protein
MGENFIGMILSPDNGYRHWRLMSMTKELGLLIMGLENLDATLYFHNPRSMVYIAAWVN